MPCYWSGCCYYCSGKPAHASSTNLRPATINRFLNWTTLLWLVKLSLRFGHDKSFKTNLTKKQIAQHWFKLFTETFLLYYLGVQAQRVYFTIKRVLINFFSRRRNCIACKSYRLCYKMKCKVFLRLFSFLIIGWNTPELDNDYYAI